MTRTAAPHNPERNHAQAATATPRIVAAPAATRAAGLGIILGVLAQAALAGGFLAGRSPLRGLHEYVGYALLVAAIIVLVVGLAGRRSRPERLTEVGTRVALVLALAATTFAGMRASRGTTDLLMLHIPLAFAVTALATRLVVVSQPHVRDRPPRRRQRNQSDATA